MRIALVARCRTVDSPSAEQRIIALVDVDGDGGRAGRRWLVVVRLERSLVDLIVGTVRLRRRLDVDEGHRGAQTNIFFPLRQQLHALHAAIPFKMLQNPVFSCVIR